MAAIAGKPLDIDTWLSDLKTPKNAQDVEHCLALYIAQFNPQTSDPIANTKYEAGKQQLVDLRNYFQGPESPPLVARPQRRFDWSKVKTEKSNPLPSPSKEMIADDGCLLPNGPPVANKTPPAQDGPMPQEEEELSPFSDQLVAARTKFSTLLDEEITLETLEEQLLAFDIEFETLLTLDAEIKKTSSKYSSLSIVTQCADYRASLEKYRIELGQ